MLFLIGGIAGNIAILLIVRSFSNFGIKAFPAIVVNYFVAATLSLFFMENKAVLVEAKHLMPVALVLGAMFVSVFYLISLTAERMGVSTASVANKMSVVIPVIAAFLLYGDSINALKISGILGALFAVVLVSGRPAGAKATVKNAWWLPAAVFVGTGIIDALVNYAQKKIVATNDETAALTGMFFYAAGFFGLIAFLVFERRKKEINYPKTILAGIILGVPNYFSIYLVMRAITENVLESSVLYPIVNVGVVLGSTVGAFFIFKEKLSVKNWLGVLVSVAAIIMITLS